MVDAREMALTPHCKVGWLGNPSSTIPPALGCSIPLLCLPIVRVQLQPTSLDLGCLSYVQRHSLPLVLSATGGAPAAWEMAPVPGSAAACPPWLSLHPSSVSGPSERTLAPLEPSWSWCFIIPLATSHKSIGLFCAGCAQARGVY